MPDLFAGEWSALALFQPADQQYEATEGGFL